MKSANAQRPASTALATAVLLVLGTYSAACDGCASHSGADSGSGGDARLHADAGVQDVYVAPVGSLLELDEIPIERLCEAFTSGYYRYVYAMAQSMSATMNDVPMLGGCYGEMDPRTFDFLATAANFLKDECKPDAPTATNNLGRRVAASVAAGRVRYDGAAAMACVLAGRSFIDSNGGLMQAFVSQYDAGSDDAAGLLQACEGWFEGLVDVGGSCDEHWECQAAQFCKRSAQSCAGSCTPLVPPGQSCDRFDRCQQGECVNGTCQAEPIYDGGVDASTAGSGQPCGYQEGGYVDCVEGLYCTYEDLCAALPGSGEPCSPDRDCASGLTCGPDANGDPTCGPPRQAGADCKGYSSACAECFTCVPDTSAEDSSESCRPVRADGESCGPGQGNCQLGLACVHAQCHVMVARDQACVVDADAAELVGSCLAVDDFCRDEEGDGSGTCSLRSAEGEPCLASPIQGSTRGSCGATYLFCKRSSASADRGTCTRSPQPGETCGNRYDLDDGCITPLDEIAFDSATCTAGEEVGAVGICLLSSDRAAAGQPCAWDSDCADGHYCHDDDSVCTAGAAMGQLCSDTDYTCANGRCDYGDTDAGFEYICQPFLSQGATCGYSGDDSCGPDLRCADDGAGDYTCTPRAAQDELCESVRDCAAGLSCQQGVCVAERCERDGCLGCGDASGLTALLFFAVVVMGAPLRRRRRD